MRDSSPDARSPSSSGDVDALVRFIEENKARLLTFIERRVSTSLSRKIEPEDILQEVHIEAVRALENTELRTDNLLHWLFQIAERKIIDAHRRFFASQKRDASREAAFDGGSRGRGDLGALLAASMTTPSQAFSRDQKQLRMLAALDTLPDEQREAIRQRYLIGLSSKEIAKKLGKSDGAIRIMLSRGVRRLQELLADSDG